MGLCTCRSLEVSSSHCNRMVELVTKNLVWVVAPGRPAWLGHHRDRLGSEDGDQDEQEGRIHRPDVAKAIRIGSNARGSLGRGVLVRRCRRSLPIRFYAAFVVRKEDPRPLLAGGHLDLCLGHVCWASRRTSTVHRRRGRHSFYKWDVHRHIEFFYFG